MAIHDFTRRLHALRSWTCRSLDQTARPMPRRSGFRRPSPPAVPPAPRAWARVSSPAAAGYAPSAPWDRTSLWAERRRRGTALVDADLSREQDRRRLRRELLDVLDQLAAVHLRHGEVGEHEVNAAALEDFQR